MARNSSTAHVAITVDGKQAVDVMKALSKQAKITRDNLKEMEAKGLINTDEYKDLVRELKSVESALKQGKNAYMEVDKVMANLSGTTLTNLQKALKQVRKDMHSLSADDPMMKVKMAQYQAIDNQIGKITGQWKRQDGAIRSVIKRLTAYVSVYGGFNLISGQLTKIVQGNIAFSDSLADIRKTTGLSAEDVNRLSDAINKIDTRTSREELHSLAYEAGRLGLGKYGAEGILGFTKAADQLSVALKEDLGQDAIVQLVKMADVMGLIPKMGVEKSLLAIGSSVNTLAQSTTSTGTYMTDYSRRLSGIAVQAHLSAAELFGLAAASDSTGQEVEVAATAMNKFVVQLQTHYKTVAAAAGISEDALHGLLEQGKTAEAIVMVLGALGEKGGLSMLAPLMKDMGSDGARLTASLATMASNIDKVEESIRLSKEAFGEATSVTNEYNIKNETAAAILEKMKNSWDKLFTNQANTGVIRDLVQDFSDLSAKMQTNELLIQEVKIAIFLLINAVKALVAMIPYLTIFLSIKGWIALSMAIKSNVIPAFKIMITSLGAMFKSMTVTTAGVNGLARAWKILNTVLKSNVFIAVASLVATLIFSFKSIKKEMNDVATSANNLNKSFKDYTRTSSSASVEANLLFGRLKNLEKGTAERSRLIKQINTQYKDYLPALISEKSSLNEIEKAQEEVNKKLRQSLALKAQNAAIDEAGIQYSNKMADSTSRLHEIYASKGLKGVGDADIQYMIEAAQKYRDAGMTFKQMRDKVWKELYWAKEGEMGRSGSLTKHGGALYNELNDLESAFNTYMASYWNQQVAVQNIQKKYKDLIGNFKEKEEQVEPFTIVESEEDSEQKKREREALKAARGKYQAVMSAIEVFYKQQQQVINQAYVEQKITSERREQELDAIELKHLQTRIEARKKLHGDENTWDMELGGLPSYDMAKTQDSSQAIANLMDKDLKTIGEELRKYGEKEDDGIWAKLEEDKLKMQKVAIDHIKEVEKVLLEYDLTGKVTKQYQGQLEKLKLFFIDYTDLTKAGYTSATEAAEAGMKKLLSISTELFDIDINTDEGLNKFKGMIMDAEEFGGKMLNLAADDYRTLYYKVIEYGDAMTEAQKKARERQLKIASERYQRTDEYKKDKKTSATDDNTEKVYKSAQTVGLATDSMIQDQEVLTYQHRLEAAMRYYEYLESHGYDTEKQMLEVQEAVANLSSKLTEQMAAKLSNMKEYADAIADFGTEFGASVFVSGEDGLEARQKALENLVRSFGEATKKIIMNWVTQKIEHAILRKAMIDTEEKYEDEMTDTDSSKEKKTEKIEQKTAKAALKRGEKFIKQKLFVKKKGAEEEEHIEEQSQDAQETLATEGAGEVGKALISIGQKTVSAKKEQAAENVATAGKETTGETTLGIASGAAKTIGRLGWWGIPLVAVITALLNGLLSMAMSKVSSLFGGGGDTETAAAQTKLVTGMLTYDKGNVQQFSGVIDGKSYPVMGDDGKVYQATRAEDLQTGLVTNPIIAMVNGQPSLIAEHGPEFIMGRETTAAMMMSRPELMAELVRFDKNHSGKGYKTYDSGNVQRFASSSSGVDAESGEEEPMDINEVVTSVIAKQLSPVLTQIGKAISANASTNAALAEQLSKGIKASINKNGRGGLVDEVIDGMAFAKKHGTSDKLRTLFDK